MYIPVRKSHDHTRVCTRTPRLLSAATAGVMTMGAAFGLVPAASADPVPGKGVSMTVDIVGDSYTAGEGIRDTYLDPADQRHRSLVAPALQALSRVATGSPGLSVDANVAAASGATFADFFTDQRTPAGNGGGVVVNPAQRDQVRPDADIVIVGFGGSDAQLAQVLADAKQARVNPAALDARIGELAALLDSAASDAEYLSQARVSPPGRAPTLVARMLQVLAAVSQRAPHAVIVVTNYPLAVDPQNGTAASMIGERHLTSVRKFAHDLNRAIERAVRICRCATLVDVSGAVAGHEAYSSDSAFNERSGEQSPRELFHPNHKGAALLANPLAAGIARLLGVNAPAASDGTPTVPKGIAVRSGVPDRDGDTVPDFRDRAPHDPTRSEDRVDEPKPEHPKAKHGHGPAASGGKSKQFDRHRGHGPRPATVSKVIAPVVAAVLPPPAPAQGPTSTGKQEPAAQPKPSTPNRTYTSDEGTRERGRDRVFTGDTEAPAPGFLRAAPAPPALAPKRDGGLVERLADKRIAGAEAAQRKPGPKSFNLRTEQESTTDSETNGTDQPGTPVEIIVVRPDADGAQRACILIFPAPPGCESSEREGLLRYERR